MFDPGLMDMIMRLRSRGISDNLLLKAMELVPRKYFTEDKDWDHAYDDRELAIACGQSLSAPLTIAQMNQSLDVRPDHKLLEIGTGSGYHAAVLSHMAKRVYSVERYKSLMKLAESRFRSLSLPNLVLRHGDGRYGWKGQSPFDRIIITAGVLAVPDGLMAQLAPGGRLVAVVDGELTTYDKARTKITTQTILPMILPPLEAGKSKQL